MPIMAGTPSSRETIAAWQAIQPSSVPAKKKADAIINAIGGNVGGHLVIESCQGTDLRLGVPAGNWSPEFGCREGEGTNGIFGELMTAPFWGNGRIVLTPGGFLTNPINCLSEKATISITDNHIVDIRGGSQAAAFRKMLERANNPLTLNLAEFAIQLNPG